MTKKSEIYVDDTSFMGLGGCLGGFMGVGGEFGG